MKVGFIGAGSMGCTLITSFIQSKALQPHQIVASNRTRSKVDVLAALYPGLQVAQSNEHVIINSEIIFLCIRPVDFKKVIDEISYLVHAEHIIISITSPILIEHLESQLTAKICKVIPSITHLAGGGASLVTHGVRMQHKDQQCVEQLLAFISKPVLIEEQFVRICSDISSCGPAFLAAFLEKFISTANRLTQLSEEQATLLVAEMILGTGKLLTTAGFTPSSLQQRIAVPGGITAAGLHIIDQEIDGLFERIIDATHSKFKEDVERANQTFKTSH